MIAKCLEMIYEEGWRSTSQNTKKRDIRYEKGCFHWDNGNGWQENFKTSKLILKVEYENNIHEIWIDKFFKERSIRLTENFRETLKINMPNAVNIIKFTSPRGTIYYKVLDLDLEKWLEISENKTYIKRELKPHIKKELKLDLNKVVLKLKSITNNNQCSIIYKDDYIDIISKQNGRYFYKDKKSIFEMLKIMIINNIKLHGEIVDIKL